jgi:type I restriction enzyme S subunit
MNNKNATYKDSPLGIIPSDWEVKHFEEVADIDKECLNGSTPKDYEFEYISLSDVDCDVFKIETTKQVFANAPSRARRIVKKGDILMATVRPNLQGFSLIRDDVKNMIASTGFAIITTKKCNNEFLYQYLFSSGISKQLYQLLVGSNYPAINSSDVRKLKIPLPPFPEQKAIAQLLSIWDDAITKTQDLIAQRELRKKWLMQNLLTGKKRLKGFGGLVQFHILSNYINEVSERNKDNKITRILSVTNSKGFINQVEQFDRVVASDNASNYKIVRRGQFAYNPSRVNVGSLDLLRNFDEGILSPMYVVFEANEQKINIDFLYHHLKSSWFTGHIPMFVQGSVRDSLSFDSLCGMKFFIPPLQEQTEIAQVLESANKEIQLLKTKTEKLREQKKGLMQVLLTGGKRLHYDI